MHRAQQLLYLTNNSTIRGARAFYLSLFLSLFRSLSLTQAQHRKLPIRQTIQRYVGHGLSLSLSLSLPLSLTHTHTHTLSLTHTQGTASYLFDKQLGDTWGTGIVPDFLRTILLVVVVLSALGWMLWSACYFVDFEELGLVLSRFA